MEEKQEQVERRCADPHIISLEQKKDEPAPTVRRDKNRVDTLTFGDLDLVVSVAELKEAADAEHLLILPYEPKTLTGLDRATVRVFRYDPASRSLKPVWNSGINLAYNFVWAKIRRPGTYVPIGLPRDRLLQESLRALAHERRLRDIDDPKAARELTMPYCLETRPT